jgi:hypothetical protein
MSQLPAIYAALASAPLTVDGISVTARFGATLIDRAESAHLPARLLLPMGTARLGATVATPRTFARGVAEGGVLEIDWTITDLLLWRGLAAGVGLQDSAAELVAYTAAYAPLVVGRLRTPRWSVTEINFPAIGGVEWPPQSERWFLGVQAQVTIHEIV